MHMQIFEFFFRNVCIVTVEYDYYVNNNKNHLSTRFCFSEKKNEPSIWPQSKSKKYSINTTTTIKITESDALEIIHLTLAHQQH